VVLSDRCAVFDLIPGGIGKSAGGLGMKSTIAVASLAVLLIALYFFYGGHQTPPGQPPLLSLNQANFSALADAFNAAPRSVRLIALLSPT
jgi:hypothetical protein